MASAVQCGLTPLEISLKRGERQKLVFWTDQPLIETEEEVGDDIMETTTKDYFLEAVNGGSTNPSIGHVSHQLITVMLRSW